jgi:hypothetical protein
VRWDAGIAGEAVEELDGHAAPRSDRVRLADDDPGDRGWHPIESRKIAAAERQHDRLYEHARNDHWTPRLPATASIVKPRIDETVVKGCMPPEKAGDGGHDCEPARIAAQWALVETRPGQLVMQFLLLQVDRIILRATQPRSILPRRYSRDRCIRRYSDVDAPWDSLERRLGFFGVQLNPSTPRRRVDPQIASTGPPAFGAST